MYLTLFSSQLVHFSFFKKSKSLIFATQGLGQCSGHFLHICLPFENVSVKWWTGRREVNYEVCVAFLVLATAYEA